MRVCILLLPALALPALDALPPPAVPPVFKASGGQRLPAELRTSSFTWDKTHYDQPSLVLGNKRIGFRELSEPVAEPSPVIVVDGRKVARIQFWGGTSGDNWGYPFRTRAGTAVALSTDPEARSITLAKPYVQANGENATFTLVLRPAGDGKVEVAWDLGVPQERIDAEPKAFAGVSPWLMSAGPQAPCTVNGQAISITAATAADGREQRLATGAALEFVHEPETPLAAFALALPARYPFTALGTFKDGDGHLFIKTDPPRAVARDRFVIDFGRCSPAAADAPPPVAGIDFWAQDRLHVPRSTTRNLWPNPGFEQGLRYWSWWHGGGRYAPGREQEFSVGEDARFGRRALLIRPGQPGGMALQSFTLPVVKGRAYTVSFHAKGEKEGARLAFGVESPLAGSAHTYQKAFSSRFPLTAGWQRHSFSFIPDTPAIMLVVEAPCVTAIDGIQIEEGEAATDYVEPAVQGDLETADGDDQFALGQPIEAVFVVRGAPGASVAADLRLDNFFHERLFTHTATAILDAQGEARMPLALPAERLGAGVFVLEAALRAGDGPAERDFHRLSIMPYLANRHATKDVFGNLGPASHSRASDLSRQCMRWGFGSSTYGRQKPELAAIADRFRIANYLMIVSDQVTGDDRTFLTEVRHTLTAITPEQERRIEDIAFRVVAAHPWGTSWSLSTESECSPMIRAGDFGEWAKVQLATWRGVKRANRDAIVLPDGGTSGYSRLRGHRETGGYLAATAGKVRWDAIAVHPYGAVDGVRGTWDLDVEIQRLSDQMAEHGYGKETPIDLTEGFNECPLKVQEWNTGCNDYYNNGKPTYAFGWKEYLQACWAARSYLICLKHWPQVRSYNIWLGRVSMDLQLTPYAVCKVPNTLGHLLGEPVFKADVRPAAGVRAYVFEDLQGRGVAAAWCTIDRVEDGLQAGPQLLVRLGDTPCEFIDLMGNQRHARSENGITALQLGSAPLFIRSTPGGTARLVAALEKAEVAGAGSALSLTVQPCADGAIEAVAANLTGRPLRGELRVAGTAIPFDLPAKGASTHRLPGGGPNVTGRLHTWKDDIAIAFPGGSSEIVAWDLQYLYVPRTARPLPADPAAPEWKQIPAIPVTNWFIQKPVDGEPVPGGQPNDLEARCQIAWDKDNLYLRVDCVDDRFVLTEPERFTKSVGGSDPTLYKNDGCLELYLDTAANGRSNTMRGFDQDDYRYDIWAGNPAASDGPGLIHRLREVYHQLAGGIDMPNKEAAAKGITSRFIRQGGRYTYVLIFPQRFIEPLKLERGWRAGLGLFIHDNDSPERQWPGKGLSLATAPGTHCDGRPDLWPTMILGD